MKIEYASLPGEVPPPVPDGPRLCSGDDMRILHNAFLWGYEQAPELVRAVLSGDTNRSKFVGEWLSNLDKTLHSHHESEDLLLWEKLEKRSPSCALHVGQMRAHHAQVASLLDDASPLLEHWTTTADTRIGEQLAEAYERLLEVLKVHLRREVVEVVPIAEKVLTAEEWEAIGEHSRAAIPKSRLLPQLGMLFANSSPEDRAAFYATMPAAVKFLWKVSGRRQYKHEYEHLFPGEPIPETI